MENVQKCRVARKLFERRMDEERWEEYEQEIMFAPSECGAFIYRASQRFVKRVFDQLGLDPDFFEAVCRKWGETELANDPNADYDGGQYIPLVYGVATWALDYQFSPAIRVI